MKSSGQEQQRELVIARGSTCLGDTITVILDGDWSKHTHKHSYNAKSGWPLFIGENLVYGSSVVYGLGPLTTNHLKIPATKTGMVPMEADIVLEGFNKCVERTRCEILLI